MDGLGGSLGAVVSEDFPTTIRFWIKVKGIPTIYSSDDALWEVARELGHGIEVDVSLNLIRVELKGSDPLVFKMVLPFDTGVEAIISLDYDKLCYYCDYCFLLSHTRETCPELVKPAEAAQVANTVAPGVGTKAMAEGQWEAQRRKSAKRTYSNSDTDGQVAAARPGGVSFRDAVVEKQQGSREWERQAKMKSKSLKYARSRQVQGPGKSRSNFWPEPLFPRRKESTSVMVSGTSSTVASSSMAVAAQEPAAVDAQLDWAPADGTVTLTGFQLKEDGILGEEGEYIHSDQLDEGVMALENCLQASLPPATASAPTGNRLYSKNGGRYGGTKIGKVREGGNPETTG